MQAYNHNQHPVVKKVLVAAFCLITAFVVSACGGGSPDGLPLNRIMAGLAGEPTYSILLEDMKQEGTFSKTYYHKYLVVQPDGSHKTDWHKVPKSYYNETQGFLGMALFSKKDGVKDTQVSPPGYNFVGDPEYGRWRQDAQGGSFWEFYGKYAFFSSLFGGWYHPVYRSDYSMYSQHRSRKQPFFGRNQEFGSSGKIVKTKRPGFYSRRMAGVNAGKSSFKSKASKRVGRTKTGFRSRSGGSGK